MTLGSLEKRSSSVSHNETFPEFWAEEGDSMKAASLKRIIFKRGSYIICWASQIFSRGLQASKALRLMGTRDNVTRGSCLVNA